jgi:hypothetical protein
MTCPSLQSDLLPLPLPAAATQRLVLRCLRRMAAHGTRDAQAALLAFDHFGIHFRRPLVLLRAFVTELAQGSGRRITLAPCCAMRMTRDEGWIVGVLATAATYPDCASHRLRLLTGGDQVASPLSLAVAFNQTLAELGRPLAL